MIKVIIFWIVCVKYNEAFVDIADDLDYVGVSGTFIPLSKNFETYDELSVRQYDGYNKLDQAQTIQELIKLVKNLIKNSNRFQLYNCSIKLFRTDDKSLSFQPERTCAELDVKKFIEKFFPKIKDINVLLSDLIQSDILSIKEFNVTENQVIISVDLNGSCFAKLFVIQNLHLNFVIPISETGTFSLTLSADVKNVGDVKVEFKLPENGIAELSISFSQLNIESLLKLLILKPLKSLSYYNDLSFLLDSLNEKFIDAEIKGLYNTSNKHLQLYAKVIHEYKSVHFSINFIFDVINHAKKMAFAVQLNSITSLFDALDKKSKFHIPKFIKKLIGNCTLTAYSYKKKENLTLLDKDFIIINEKALTAIDYGINIYIGTQIKDSLKKCGESNTPIREKLYLKKSNIIIHQSKSNLTRRNTDYIQASVKGFIKTHINQERLNLMQQPRINQTPKDPQIRRHRDRKTQNRKRPNNERQNNRSPMQQSHSKQSNSRPSSQQPPQNSIKTKTDEDLVKIILTPTNIVIKLPKNFSENLDSLLKCFFQEIQEAISYTVPDFLNDIMNKYHISELSFSQKEYKITIEYTEEIKAPFDLVLKKSTFEVLLKILKKEKEKTIVFKGHAEIYFTWSPTTNGEMKFTFNKLSNIAVDIILLNTNIGSFSSFVRNQNNLGHYITKFKNIAVKSIIISGNIDLRGMKGQLILSATAVIHNMPDATFTIFIWNYKKLEIAFGLIIKKVCLSDALDRFAGIEKSDSWFDGAHIALLLSNAAKNSKPSKLKLLKKNSYSDAINELRNKIESGFLVEASYEFKENGNWKNNSVLNFLYDHGVRKILLKGKFDIISKLSIHIEAHIETDISLHDESGLSLKNISLVLNIESQKKEIFLKILFKMKTPDVILTGTVKLSQSGGLELSASMQNMVYKPFGWNWLAFGNLFVSFEVKTLQLKVKAEVWFGNIPTSQQNMIENTEGLFKFEGFIGISFKSHLLWFLYFKRTGDNFTIETILKALGFNFNVPEVIAKTGFIGESIVSISLLDQKIDDFNMTIPHGLFLKGCLSIFNYKVAFEINVSLKEFNFSFKGWFDPISLGGILMYRSSHKHYLGPILHVQVNSGVNVYIEAFVSFFGMSSEIKIIFNDKQLYFGLHNNLFGVLKTNIKVEADYTSSSHLSNFRMSGSVESEGLTEVTGVLKNKFIKVKKDVENMKKTVFDFLKNLGIYAIESTVKFLDACKTQLEKKLEELEAEENKLKKQRKQEEIEYENCLKICQEHKNSECRFDSFSDILSWRRIENCIKKFSFTIIENICRAECEGKNVINYVSNELETTAIKVFKIFPSTALGFLNIVKSLLHSTNMIFNWTLFMNAEISNIENEINKEYRANEVDSCKVTNISVESGIDEYKVDTVIAQVDCGINKRTIYRNDIFLGSCLPEFLASDYSEVIVPQTEKFKQFQKDFTLHKDNVATDFNLVKDKVIGLKNDVKSIFGNQISLKQVLFERSVLFPMEYQDNATRTESYFYNPQLFPIEESVLCHQHQNVISRYSTIATIFALATNYYIDKFKVSSFSQNRLLNHSKSVEGSALKTIDQKVKSARQVINEAIESERGMKLPEYIKYLDSFANNNRYTNNSLALHDINEILLNVATNENMPTVELVTSISKIQQMLLDMEESSIPCTS